MLSKSPSILPAATRSIGSGRTFALHLWAFVLPLINLVFLLSGPHVWWSALLWSLPIVGLVLMDNGAPPDHRQPPESLPKLPFDLQLYLLVALQLVNHVLVGVMASKLHVGSLGAIGTTLSNLFTVIVLSGTTAGYSGIVLAHELVHRRSRFEFFLGRLLLVMVCYEQFATEHVRGHHPRLGTAEDPATARFGETLTDFVRRTIPAQFASAWRLEKVRLGDEQMRWSDPRMLRHRVLQGVVAEVLVVAAYLAVFGPVAVVFFVVQARTAVVLLETVNYIEHWGITRATRAVTPVDSWDTDNGFTLRTLIGLSRHADHHAQASRPYQTLRYFEQSPKMPLGYYGTILLAMFRNDEYQARAKAELMRRGLGPYRESLPPVSDAPGAAPAYGASAQQAAL
ncbi:MAG TPA: fatty acid desaturase [Polyangiaceae bacterium]|jgi:alkane 1-monooxygenase|nr:fatty acid desaturase [Polyangiaceae bacterium]